jgi:hypothetical protein
MAKRILFREALGIRDADGIAITSARALLAFGASRHSHTLALSGSLASFESAEVWQRGGCHIQTETPPIVR